MANLDISSKLSHEPQTITIAEGKTYKVDCSAETMLKAQDIFKKDNSFDGLFQAIELLLGKEASKEIKDMKVTQLKGYKLVVCNSATGTLCLSGQNRQAFVMFL